MEHFSYHVPGASVESYLRNGDELLVQTHIIVRGSLRMRNFTPWSANDRDRKVDSIIPGKFLGGETLNRSEITVFK